MEKRTAIIPRTNRRVALFNSKVNKKLADRRADKARQGKEGMKKKDKMSENALSTAIYSTENFPRMS
ncbi:hypothetical protein ALC62_02440 [Cyphomyrmex costatus]|uniref:Uncharacterized protein n=1 Tax=Cyphomyrmex costatus TaxID=456900 RepID=A0A195D155_9HYME|nr:hypothetical protein ALC62_02440 [Cyphomyrmex costatus]